MAFLPGPNTPLSESQLAQSAQATAQGLFAGVSAPQLFGPQSDGPLAADVLKRNPVLYRTLRLEMRYINKELRRPEQDE